MGHSNIKTLAKCFQTLILFCMQQCGLDTCQTVLQQKTFSFTYNNKFLNRKCYINLCFTYRYSLNYYLV